MECTKIEKIKKAAAITAKVLNVFKIFLIVTIILCVFNGVVSMFYKGGETGSFTLSNNTVKFNNATYAALVKLLNRANQNDFAWVSWFVVAVMVALVLAVVIILRKTFIEIRESDSPYREEILQRIKALGILVTLIVFSYSIGNGVIIGLTFWCIYCIYDYGIVLQRNDDETL